jgi:hypothetical protein
MENILVFCSPKSRALSFWGVVCPPSIPLISHYRVETLQLPEPTNVCATTLPHKSDPRMIPPATDANDTENNGPIEAALDVDFAVSLAY